MKRLGENIRNWITDYLANNWACNPGCPSYGWCLHVCNHFDCDRYNNEYSKIHGHEEKFVHYLEDDFHYRSVIINDKVRGSLIGGAIGDALGYPVEFLKALYVDMISFLSSSRMTLSSMMLFFT